MQYLDFHAFTVVKMLVDDPAGKWKKGDVGVASEAGQGLYAVSLPGGHGQAPRSMLVQSAMLDTSLGAMQTHVVSIQTPAGEPMHELQEWTDLELIHHCARYGINKPSSDLRMPYVWFHSDAGGDELLELHIFSSNGQQPNYRHYARIGDLLATSAGL